MKRIRGVAVLCLLLGFGGYAFGQGNDAAQLKQWSKEYGFTAQFSPNSPNLIGQTTGRRLFDLEGQFSWVLLTSKHMALKYVGEIVPLAIIHQRTEYYVDKNGKPAGSQQGGFTYAAGVNPLGLQLNFRRGHKWQPFVDGRGGLLYFTHDVPVPNSSQFNFTFHWGGGIQVFTGKKSSISFGYRFQHLSNAETAPRNPGVDSNMIFFGMAWGR